MASDMKSMMCYWISPYRINSPIDIHFLSLNIYQDKTMNVGSVLLLQILLLQQPVVQLLQQLLLQQNHLFFPSPLFL